MKIVLAGYNIDTGILEKLKQDSYVEFPLTPETIAAAYARISRDPAPVTDLREQAVKDVDSARKSASSIVFDMNHQSIAEHAELNPIATTVGSQIRPTLWQRIKSLFGNNMLDRFIAKYVTPEGLPKLYRYRQSIQSHRSKLGMSPPDPTWIGRVLRFLRRVKRAEFLDLTRIEIEMQDRFKAERHYLSTFDLVGLEWKLTSLRVISTNQAVRPTSQTY